jgi:hypothetical protein
LHPVNSDRIRASGALHEIYPFLVLYHFLATLAIILQVYSGQQKTRLKAGSADMKVKLWYFVAIGVVTAWMLTIIGDIVFALWHFFHTQKN